MNTRDLKARVAALESDVADLKRTSAAMHSDRIQASMTMAGEIETGIADIVRRSRPTVELPQD